MKKIFLFLFLLNTYLSSGQDATRDLNTKNEYIETLRFGIEKEIMQVLKDIGNYPSKEIYSILIERYNESSLPETRTNLLRYFGECPELPRDVIDMIYDEALNEPANNKLHTALLVFLGKKGSLREGKLLIERLDHFDAGIQSTAADALSKFNDPLLTDLVLNRLEEADGGDDKYLSDDIKSKLILSFGEMRSVSAVPYLKKQLDNDINDKFIIMYSMYSLAKIGDIDSIDIISKNLDSDDIKIQEYSGYSLSIFKTEKVIPILIRMLRHNNEKIRVFACQGIVINKAVSSIPILEYKVKKDPSNAVKNEAFASLLYLGHEGLSSVKRIYQIASVKDQYLSLISDAVSKKPDTSNVEFILSIYDGLTDKQKEIVAKNLVRGTSNALDPFLTRLLRSEDPLMRIGALKAIYQIKDSTLSNKLSELSKSDPSPIVRKTAEKYRDLKGIDK